MQWLKKSALAVVMFSAAAASQAGPNVGVSVEISQPGVFGRVDIGRFPQPQVVVQQPIIIAPPPRYVEVQREPVYLWVPPGHRRDWRNHCSRYNACGVPVYFVNERWYQNNVWQGRGQERGRDDWRDDRRGGGGRDGNDDRRGGDGRDGNDDRRDRHHGHGHGHD